MKKVGKPEKIRLVKQLAVARVYVLYQGFEKSDPPAGKGGGPITKLGGKICI